MEVPTLLKLPPTVGRWRFSRVVTVAAVLGALGLPLRAGDLSHGLPPGVPLLKRGDFVFFSPAVFQKPANEAEARRQVNWARVLTHELVHVVTLQQTQFNIPHWFTEGLAVGCENHPRPAEWNKLLAARVPKIRLSNTRWEKDESLRWAGVRRTTAILPIPIVTICCG